MARLVSIPTGVTSRRGSDGSGFAVGAQLQSGTPLTKINYTSAVGTDNIASGRAAGTPISFYLDNHGEGPITISIDGTTTADAEFNITGRDEDGNVLDVDLTLTAGANPSETTTQNFAGIYLTTITPPAAFTPTTATWGASVTTIANTVTGGVVPILFPVSNLDMNEDAAIDDSDLITGLGAATPPDIGQYSGHMNFTTGVLTEELPYLIAGILPTTGGNTSTPCRHKTQARRLPFPPMGK